MHPSGKLGQLISLISAVRQNSEEAAAISGKNWFSQLIEVIGLRLGSGKLLAEDYYLYELYDDSQFSNSDKKAFISPGALPSSLWAQRSGVLADDKAIFYLAMSAMGYEIPKLYGFYHTTRKFGMYSTFDKPTDLLQYLINDANYPLVIKPIRGIFSQDVIALSKCEPDYYGFTTGSGFNSKEMLEFIVAHSCEGLIIQELLDPHPKIRNLCGPRLCTLRILVLNGTGGPLFLSAFLKIASKSNMADNFWRAGNSLASIDLESGRIQRCVTGYNKKVRQIECHPETGNPLVGFQIPDWELAKKLCIQAAAALPGLPMQAWDVALTDRGPVLLEVNIVGSLFLPQLATQSGLLTGKLKSFLRSVSSGQV